MVVVWRRRSKEEKIKGGIEGRAGAAGREGRKHGRRKLLFSTV